VNKQTCVQNGKPVPTGWSDTVDWNVTFMIGGAITSLIGFWSNLLHVAPKHACAFSALEIVGSLSLLAGCVGLLGFAYLPESPRYKHNR
jgi:hypothetical protein